MNNVKQGIKTNRFGSRLLAFVLALAMIIGVMPTAFAVDGEGHLKGGVRFTTADRRTNITETAVGDDFTIFGVFNTLAATETFDFTARMYLTMDGVPDADIFQYVQIPTFTNADGTIKDDRTVKDATHTYTLNQDANGTWYIEISPIHPGGTDTVGFGAMFIDGKSVDGNSLTVTLKEVVFGQDNTPTGEVKTIDHVNYPNPATITAKAEPTLTNTKSVDKSSVSFEDGATALSDDLTYTVGVRPLNAGTKIQSGDSQITSYTVTDTITLPEGLTYTGTVADLDLPTYNSSAVIADDKKSITVTWTVTNGSDGYQASNQDYTLKIPGSKIAVGSFDGGEIVNSVNTDYTYEGWVVNNGTGSKGDKTKTSNTATASTYVSKTGNGLSDVSKTFPGQSYASGSGGNDWRGIWGYTVAGDVVEYTINVKNDSTSTKTYTITDELSEYGLTFAGVKGVGSATWTWDSSKGTNVSNLYYYTDSNDKKQIYDNEKNSFIGADTINFEIDLKGGETATFTFYATVGELPANTDSRVIVNRATIAVNNGVSTEVKAPEIEERKGTPKLTISKDAKNSSNESISGYEANDEFNYVITLTNTGTAAAEDVDFSDVLPAGLVLNGGNYTISKNGGAAETKAVATSTSDSGATLYTAAIDDQTMARGETWTITIPVKVVSEDLPSVISNDASATYNTGEKDDNDDPVRETVTANNTLVDKTVKITDLDITKTANVSSVKAGGEIVYTIIVTNKNSYYSYEDDIIITDIPVGDGLTLTGCEILPSVGTAVYNESTKSYTVTITKDLGTNTSVNFTVKAKVDDNFAHTDSSESVTNKATIKDGKEATATTPVVGTENGSIEVTKTAFVDGVEISNPGYVAAGKEITFRVRVTNPKSAKSNLTYFKITDTLAGYYDQYISGANYTINVYRGEVDVDGRTPFVGKDSDTWSTYSETFGYYQNYLEFQYSATNESSSPAYIKQDDAILEPGQYIEYEYKVITSSETGDVYNKWMGGSNTVTVYNDKNEPQGDSTVTYYTPEPTATPAPTAAPTADPNATATPAPVGPAMEITKTATYVGNDGSPHDVIDEVSEVPAGNAMTFTIRLTNTGSTNITRYSLFDYTDGASIPVGSQTSLTIKNNEGNVITFAGRTLENVRLDMIHNLYDMGSMYGLYIENTISSYASAWEEMPWNYDHYKMAQNPEALSPDLVLAPNEHIDFIYTVTTSKEWTAETTGKNTVVIDAYDENDESMSGTADIEYKRGEPSNISDAVLTLDKDANIKNNTDPAADFDPASKTTTQVLQQENGDLKIDYRVVLKNTSQTEDFTVSSASFTDVLPEGAQIYVPNSGRAVTVTTGRASQMWQNDNDRYKTEGDYGNKGTVTITASKTTDGETTNTSLYTNYRNNEGESKIAADKLVINFPNGLTLDTPTKNWNNGVNELYILYSLIIPADKVDAFYANAMNVDSDDYGKDIKEQNEITFKAGSPFHKADGKVSEQIAAAETVDLIPPIIHPGVSKEYVGHTVDNSQNVISGRPLTLEDTVWKVTIYNGLDGNGTTMSGYALKDIIPEAYTYVSKAYDSVKTSFGGYIFKYDYSAGGTETMIDDEPIELTGNDGVMYFNDTRYDLDPGDRLIVYVVAHFGGNVDFGHYTNIVKVIPDQKFIEENVSVGAYEEYTSEDGTTYKKAPAVEASASVEILRLDTLGTKSVTYGTSTANGSDGAPNNMVKAAIGGKVTYDLEVVNNDQESGISDFTIIDRLPYVGDAAVASDSGRGSAFAIRYLPSSMKATITLQNGTVIDVTNYIDVKYGVDSTIEAAREKDNRIYFTEADADWSIDVTNKGGRIAWTNVPTASTNLVRFALKPDLSTHSNANDLKVFLDNDGNQVYGIPSNAKIKITFDGQLPDSIEDMGKTNAAWNSYAYYYNGANYQDMISEPPMVGVYVDEDVTGGRIMVRKIYKSNLTTTPVTFYFSCFKGPYDEDADWSINEQRLIGVKPLEMMGNKNGAQADLYFTNLDIDPDGKNIAYYIYESDSTGKPLTANAVYSYTTDSKGNPTNEISATESTLNKDASGNITGVSEPTVADGDLVYYKQVAVGGDVTVPFIMDNGGNDPTPEKRTNQQKQARNQTQENSKYLVWNKDLNVNKKENSAIFNNFYYPDADIKVYGPLYADVPMDNDGANAKDYMTSTRPNSFDNFNTETGRLGDSYATKSTERESANYDERIDGYGGEGVHYHTIATGFLAKITGTDDFGIQNAKWTITSTPANNPNKDKVPVLVRLRTGVVGGGSLTEATEATVLYLDDFMVMNDTMTADERSAESIGDIAALGDDVSVWEESDDIFFGGSDEIETIDDVYVSDYSVEERAAIVAEALGIDPDKILLDDFGTPYVIMDEEVEDKALYVSGSAELNDLTESPSIIEDLKDSKSVTNSSNMEGISAYIEFGDYATNKAGDNYAIYKLNPTAGKTYSWTINDDLPMTTLASGSEVYIGLIIDQLYDQYAKAELKIEDKAPTSGDIGSVLAPKANGSTTHLRYTDVDSPYYTSTFVKTPVLSKLPTNKTVTIKFDSTNFATGEVDGSLLSNDTYALLIAGKKVTVTGNEKALTVNGVAYKGHTNFSGAGSSSSCSVKMNVTPRQTLSIVGTSTSTSASATRNIRITYINTKGKEVKVDIKEPVLPAAAKSGEKSITTTPVTWTVPDDAAGEIYVSSKSSGILLYSITVSN